MACRWKAEDPDAADLIASAMSWWRYTRQIAGESVRNRGARCLLSQALGEVSSLMSFSVQPMPAFPRDYDRNIRQLSDLVIILLRHHLIPGATGRSVGVYSIGLATEILMPCRDIDDLFEGMQRCAAITKQVLALGARRPSLSGLRILLPRRAWRGPG